MTMSPAGAAPYVPVVTPAASSLASFRAFAASRLTTSTVSPALAIRPATAVAMVPAPMMLMVLMFSLLGVGVSFVLSQRGQPTGSSGRCRDPPAGQAERAPSLG